MVERLFLPFTRLDDRIRHDGFGLGLTLVSSIAAVHGGTVQATAVATGGLANTIVGFTHSIDVGDDLLTLKGLRLIYERNS